MKAIDLFSGCGGFTLGAEQAGLDVVYAANHWPAAVAAHAQNHPGTAHACQDLRQADFTQLPDFDVLMASPCCQGHSRARGKDRPQHDTARCTAWAVFECACAKLPPYVVVENVPDFRRWGVPGKVGVFYKRWLANFEDLGYQVTENVVNASTLGLPQERTRLFLVMVHEDTGRKPITVPNGTSAPRPAADIIDWDAGNWNRVLTPARAESTVRRFLKGRALYGEKFLIEYYGTSGPRRLTRPLGAVTTRDRYALVDGKYMRMLTRHEYLAAQGFPADYALPDDHKVALRMIGNAVPPPLARHVLTALAA